MGEELNFNRQFKSTRSSRHIHYIDKQNDVKKYLSVLYFLLIIGALQLQLQSTV